MYEKQSKIALLPHGCVQSSDASQTKLLGLLLLCGADHQRILDQRFPSMDDLLFYLGHIKELQQTRTRVLVALTETCPVIRCIIRTRRLLCRQFPLLDAALWIIYADPDVDPAFYASASRICPFDAKLDSAPVWEDPDGKRYLVLTPNTVDEAHAQLRARMLAAQNESLFERVERASASMNAVRPSSSKP